MSKELYIRIGNSKDTSHILIIGEEESLGSRDISGYTPHKGAFFSPIRDDPFTGRSGLTYIHITPNIKLDTEQYKSDHDVHKFIKKHCKSLVKWDGEKEEGLVRSREAFIIVNTKKSSTSIAHQLYQILEEEIHGHRKIIKNRIVNIIKVIMSIILIPIKIIFSIIVIVFISKRSKRQRCLKKIW